MHLEVKLFLNYPVEFSLFSRIKILSAIGIICVRFEGPYGCLISKFACIIKISDIMNYFL